MVIIFVVVFPANLIKANGSSKSAETGDRLRERQVGNKERQFEGAVQMNVYGEYMKAAKSWPVIGSVFLVFLATQTFMSGADYFVSIWTNWEEQTPPATRDDFEWTTNAFVYIYSGIIGLLIVFIVTRSFGFYAMCIRISANLHEMLYNGVVRAQMYFFNVNSSGRVLNRFSRDIGNVDSYLPVVLVDTIIVRKFGIFVLLVIFHVYSSSLN